MFKMFNIGLLFKYYPRTRKINEHILNKNETQNIFKIIILNLNSNTHNFFYKIIKLLSDHNPYQNSDKNNTQNFQK